MSEDVVGAGQRLALEPLAQPDEAPSKSHGEAPAETWGGGAATACQP